jgi:hypothetical protein
MQNNASYSEKKSLWNPSVRFSSLCCCRHVWHFVSREPAVNDEIVAVDVLGLVRRQEQRRPSTGPSIAFMSLTMRRSGWRRRTRVAGSCSSPLETRCMAWNILPSPVPLRVVVASAWASSDARIRARASILKKDLLPASALQMDPSRVSRHHCCCVQRSATTVLGSVWCNELTISF